METMSREKGREIVDDIRENNGGISPADRAETPASVLRSLDNVRRKLGSATQTLATNLYSKDTRFVFELIQNAEDNDYTRVEAVGDEPFLIFRLHPDKIIIDSNEDGFMEANVRAICSTGESTKNVSQGYIGEKGIGFKSVFKVASKVHIQSEPFSFFFEHRHGDGGLGMVTPIFENHHEIPSNMRTRMTLTLANPSEEDNLAKEFYNLPETLLLFLSKLKRITITRSDALGSASEVTYSKHVDPVQHQATMTKVVVSNGTADSSRRTAASTYQIKSRLLKALPQHHARLHSNQAEVVLAFPLDSQFIPIIQQQHVFAFLPIRQVGFSFQIQSDFITQASREDVERIDRNEAILSGIAETFRDAVLDFCSHPTLQFQWMRYLPSKMIFEPFWAQLLPRIVRLLKETRVLRPWSGGPLKRPDQLKRVPDYCLDEAGKPLFKDTTDRVYLSAKYQWSDFQLLDVLEVRELSFGDILTRVRADLNGPSSRWKSSTTSDDWVTRSASMLKRPFYEQDSTTETVRIRALPLIPLQGGSWVSGDSGSILHPGRDRTPVPTDLGLRLVDPQALKNPARKSLFKNLGLQKCSPKDVIALILKKYNTGSNVHLQASISHLRYLYWHLPKNERDLPKTIYLQDQESRPVYRSFATRSREVIVDDLYFETDDEYGPKELLKVSPQSNHGSAVSAPGFPAHYINSAYLTAVAPESCHRNLVWEEWLQSFAGVRRVPRLSWPPTQFNPSRLTDLFLYIVESRREKLIGTLKAQWSSYEVLMTPDIIETLSEATVPCESCGDRQLQETYLPLPSLKRICRKGGILRSFPFLRLPVELDEGNQHEWSFLETFGVVCKQDVDFHLECLRHLVRANQDLDDMPSESLSNLIQTYEAIEGHSSSDDHKRIKECFQEENAIYVSADDKVTGCWTSPEACVWKGPPFLTKFYRLATIERFCGNEKLKYLFTVILDIEDVGLTHYIIQLEEESKRQDHPTNIADIYHCIHRLDPDDTDWRLVCLEFELFKLIYVLPEAKWYPPSACLWTADTQISGKAAIAGQYASLQDFLVKHLRVEEPSIGTYIEELELLISGRESPSIEKVKTFVKKIGSWKPQQESLEPLKLLKFLPVRGFDGVLTLKCAADNFAIVDRKKCGDTFRGTIPILDFSVEEVHDLGALIWALRLADRYMSKAVEESSKANEPSLDPVLSEEMRHKAYALFRCIVHFEGPRAQDLVLYQKLQEANVYQSDRITRTMTISQNRSAYSVRGAIANVHIDPNEEQFRFFVPKDKKSRKLCYLNQLPKRLVLVLGLADTTAVRVVGSIMTASSELLEDLLTEEGIVHVPGVEPLHIETPTNDSDDSDHGGSTAS